ncbi:DUF1917-domain-containing protein [Trichocladium antarcticum]|uniref:DUF1917-domain-containing protein n=1 Tax=Trichocladium antarcticum TaxID=1450529 RepID=A0AAN6UQT7_9PEZI|nr:DUF1917-domain-containing protein [Trichocladium antarcticum]
MASDSDSDFYGDEETVSFLNTRVSNFDIAAWWATHRPILHQTIPPPTSPRPTIHNPRPHDPATWQPAAESISAFLSRLPPATTDWRPDLDWIQVANPHHSAPPGRSRRQDLARFKAGGDERLALFSAFEKTAMSMADGRSGGALIRRDVAEQRREAVADLKEFAVACGVVGGKWMLFPEPGDVNEVWAKVARATANGGLGVGAKVETRREVEKERLVCVYTKDFRDKDDVARVLNRMRELELVRPGGRYIYYKSDAWTHLGIYGGNCWGIGASTYSSTEIFSYIKSINSHGR